ncbi:hypothetical protein [Helicobacter felis]|uniref:hypothetical protein n=1 Tax=Helicobacter felis TaxID=214 RepID=UPI000CEDEBA0|nr:hypothetical protein [Helicobacter felis]
MKIENLDDLTQCFDEFATLKDKFRQADLLGDFERALELYSFLKEVARKASKISTPTDQETLDQATPKVDTQPKRDYQSTRRAEAEHAKRVEKLKVLELKEKEGTLTDAERRNLRNIRKAENIYNSSMH